MTAWRSLTIGLLLLVLAAGMVVWTSATELHRRHSTTPISQPG